MAGFTCSSPPSTCVQSFGLVNTNQTSPKIFQLNVNSFRPGLSTSLNNPPSWISQSGSLSLPYQNISVDLNNVPYTEGSTFYNYTGQIRLFATDGVSFETRSYNIQFFKCSDPRCSDCSFDTDKGICNACIDGAAVVDQ